MEEFFTIKQFAKKIKSHPNTVRKAVKEGRIQAYRTSSSERSHYRIPITEIERLCEFDMIKVLDKYAENKKKENLKDIECENSLYYKTI